MLRMHAVIGSMILYLIMAAAAQAQDVEGSEIPGTKRLDVEKGSNQGAGTALTAQEKNIVGRAKEGKVTAAEKELANDICGKKCKICFDGVTCNFNCAEKYCSK
jgi:hypothetical protein